MSKKKEALLGVRLPEEELEQLDKIAQGELSRAMIVRILLRDFLEKPEKEQREFLFRRLFGK
jgi:metal-responsive CopG/Arc/MetJ family transcriptional regulator